MGKMCSIELCPRGAYTNGFCNAHNVTRHRTSYDPNLFSVEGDITRVETTGGSFIIDTADKDLVLQHRWNTPKTVGGQYPQAKIDGRYVRLHVFLSGKKQQDHINRDTFDNRRVNLRDSTIAQNMQNRGIHKNNTSGYKGVSRNSNKTKPWTAYIGHQGKFKYLGVYSTPKEAGAAYNKAALELFGDFACLNVIT